VLVQNRQQRVFHSSRWISQNNITSSCRARCSRVLKFSQLRSTAQFAIEARLDYTGNTGDETAYMLPPPIDGRFVSTVGLFTTPVVTLPWRTAVLCVMKNPTPYEGDRMNVCEGLCSVSAKMRGKQDERAQVRVPKLRRIAADSKIACTHLFDSRLMLQALT
jgi:hypothetical protein